VKEIEYGKVVFVQSTRVLPMGIGWQSATVGVGGVTALTRRLGDGEDVLLVTTSNPVGYTLEVEWHQVSSALRREAHDATVAPKPPKREPSPFAPLVPAPKAASPVPKKKPGRPKGSKNKPRPKPAPKAAEVSDAAE